MKECRKCRLTKPHSEFYVTPANRDGFHSYCRDCHRDIGHANRMKSRYGLDLNEYLTMLVLQDSRCACCGDDFLPEPMSICIDHDHTTKKVRGLLCQGCNKGLGNFRDDPARLDKAKAYLVGA